MIALPTRRAAAGALLLALAAWSGGAAADAATPQSPRTPLAYQVYFGGLKAMALRAELDLSGGAYRATLSAHTEGVTGFLFSYTASVRSEGSLVDGHLRPVRHIVESVVRGDRRDTSLTFRPDGTIDTVVVPPADADEREPVTDAEQRGALDPISAVLSAARTLAKTGSCAQRWAVYDGRRRYDLDFSDGGREVLKPTEYSAFSGEATLCQFRYIRIAGYQKPGSGRWSNPRDVDRTYKVWLAEIVPGLPPLPVRIEAEGTFGTLVVHWVGAGQPNG